MDLFFQGVGIAIAMGRPLQYCYPFLNSLNSIVQGFFKNNMNNVIFGIGAAAHDYSDRAFLGCVLFWCWMSACNFFTNVTSTKGEYFWFCNH